MHSTNEDIIDTLLAQHQQIKVLFAQVDAARGPHKQRLFQELVALLAIHETVEEILVHPLAEKRLHSGDSVVEPRLAEEQDAKEALARLDELGVDDPAFAIELAALRDAVSAHAEAEEQLEFQALREAVDPGELRRLRGAMRAAAALSPTRPHPEIPASPAANLLLGAPVAIFDRVRDVVLSSMEAKV